MAEMGLFAIAAAMAAVGYGFYRACRRWGMIAAYTFTVSVCLLDASGVASEHLFGPQWSWNFAHHSAEHGWAALAQAGIWAWIGVTLEQRRRSSMPVNSNPK
jgi:EamA domain-containing membrane protein RarD